MWELTQELLENFCSFLLYGCWWLGLATSVAAFATDTLLSCLKKYVKFIHEVMGIPIQVKWNHNEAKFQEYI
jgi:hypothetical protein